MIVVSFLRWCLFPHILLEERVEWPEFALGNTAGWLSLFLPYSPFCPLSFPPPLSTLRQEQEQGPEHPAPGDPSEAAAQALETCGEEEARGQGQGGGGRVPEAAGPAHQGAEGEEIGVPGEEESLAGVSGQASRSCCQGIGQAKKEECASMCRC